jgi:hypothetical protein
MRARSIRVRTVQVVRDHDSFDHVGEHRWPRSSPHDDRDRGASVGPTTYRPRHTFESRRTSERRHAQARSSRLETERTNCRGEPQRRRFHASIIPNGCDSEDVRLA